MEPIEISQTQALFLSMLVNGAFGLILGLVPLIAGVAKRRVKLGLYGLVATTIGGALLGFVLSIPAMAIFTWMIIRDQIKPDEVGESEVGSEDS